MRELLVNQHPDTRRVPAILSEKDASTADVGDVIHLKGLLFALTNNPGVAFQEVRFPGTPASKPPVVLHGHNRDSGIDLLSDSPFSVNQPYYADSLALACGSDSPELMLQNRRYLRPFDVKRK
jgi:hypothetical protein